MEPFTSSSLKCTTAAWKHALLAHHFIKVETERRGRESVGATNGGCIPHTPPLLRNQACLAQLFLDYAPAKPAEWPCLAALFTVRSTLFHSAAESKQAQMRELGRKASIRDRSNRFHLVLSFHFHLFKTTKEGWGEVRWWSTCLARQGTTESSPQHKKKNR